MLTTIRIGIARPAAALMLGWATAFPAIQWQVTHGQMARGQCRLVENSIKATIHATHLDIEEEAVIQTLGTSAGSGDPNSLEIYGNFALDPAAAVVGMLLWNGDTILKAKLKGRIEANEQYEKVVDRNITPPPRPKDPAIIDFMGNGQYGIKIYPVRLGESRKLRIRYLLPLNADVRSQLGFRLTTVFRNQLASADPELRLVSATGATGIHLSVNNVPRQVALPSADLIKSGDQVVIFPKTPVGAILHETVIPEGKHRGRYVNFYAAVPQDLLNWPASDNSSVMAVLKAGDKEYRLEPYCTQGSRLSCAPLSFHAKSAVPWQPSVTWILQNRHGQEMMRTTSTAQHLKSESDIQQAVLWAASASPYSEVTEDFLGLKYGFVDRYVSLLALEEDVLRADLQPVYAWEGVPLLSEEDVIAPDTVRYAYIDHEDGGKHHPSTLLLSERMLDPAERHVTFAARVEGGLLHLPAHVFGLTEGRLEIELVDLTGSVVETWSMAASGSGAYRLPLRDIRPGLYLLRLRGDGLPRTMRVLIH